MPSGVLTFSGVLIGLPSGTRTINLSIPIPNAVDESQELSLVAGDDVVSVPAGASGVILDPPAGNSVVVALKSPGDTTGVALHPSLPTILLPDVSQVAIVLSVPMPLNGLQLTWF